LGWEADGGPFLFGGAVEAGDGEAGLAHEDGELGAVVDFVFYQNTEDAAFAPDFAVDGDFFFHRGGGPLVGHGGGEAGGGGCVLGGDFGGGGGDRGVLVGTFYGDAGGGGHFYERQDDVPGETAERAAVGTDGLGEGGVGELVEELFGGGGLFVPVLGEVGERSVHLLRW